MLDGWDLLFWILALVVVTAFTYFLVVTGEQQKAARDKLEECRVECLTDAHHGIVVDGVCYCGWRQV